MQQLRSETLFKPWPETRTGIAGCTLLLAPAVLVPCKAPPALCCPNRNLQRHLRRMTKLLALGNSLLVTQLSEAFTIQHGGHSAKRAVRRGQRHLTQVTRCQHLHGDLLSKARGALKTQQPPPCCSLPHSGDGCRVTWQLTPTLDNPWFQTTQRNVHGRRNQSFLYSLKIWHLCKWQNMLSVEALQVAAAFRFKSSSPPPS